MTSKLALLLVVLATLMSVSHASEVETTSPFVQQLYVSQITNPRSLVLDPAGNILVSTRRTFNITAIRETNHGNGTSTVETTPIFIGADLGINHGLAYRNGFLYASSSSTVYRWSYTPGQFSLLDNSTIQVVVANIPANVITGASGHSTRTIIFDDAGRLYVTVGSQTNIDENSYRSRIRRFNLGQQSLPIQFDDGEIFADGLRNTVGIDFSSRGTLFGVNNGPDMIERPDLGEEIWPDNPAEEMNKFQNPGAHYGYPYCWTTYNITGYPNGTQFAEFGFQNDGIHTDAWCRNVNNNAPPALIFGEFAERAEDEWSNPTWENKHLEAVRPPHSAPLDITFYNGGNCGVSGGFPCSSIGDAFVAFHGAGVDERVNYGYKVSWYPFNKELDLPTGDIVDVIFSPNPTPNCITCFRAVNALFNKDGHLIVSSDATNEIFRVAYNWTLPVVTNVYHDVPNSVRSVYSNHLLSFALFIIFAWILSQQCLV